MFNVSDTVCGTPSQRRVSITYRKVKPSKVRPINPEGKVAQLLTGIFDTQLITPK